MAAWLNDQPAAPPDDKESSLLKKTLIPKNVWEVLYNDQGARDYVTTYASPSEYEDYIQYYSYDKPSAITANDESPFDVYSDVTTPPSDITTAPSLNDVSYTQQAGNFTHNGNFNVTICTSELVRIAQFVYLYGIGFLAIAAILLNLLALVIFQAKPLRKFSVSINLSALALIDTISLGSYIPRKWLNDLYMNIGFGDGTTFYDRDTIACKSVTYLAYVFRFVSSWLVVAMICERLVVASNPYKHLKNQTTRMVRHSILYCAISSLIVNAHVLFIWQSVRTSAPGESPRYSCIPIAPSDFISMLLTIATVLSIVGLPFLIVTFLTGMTMRNISSWKVRPRRMSTNAICRALAEKQTTMMVCAVTSVFSFFCVPYVIAWTVLLLQHFVFKVTMCQYVMTAAARDITEVVFLLNYVVKFLVCIFAGRNVLNRR